MDVHDVPGAFELPLAAKACAESGRYAGVACLGAVIRGETDHYDYVCEAATYGISRVQLDTGVPCAFGVLTVDDMDQALARTGGGKRDSGYNAAMATVQMARLVASLRGPTGRLATLPRMAKVCHVCGKGPAFGHSRSHSMVATKRRFNPNLQKVRIDDGGTPRRVYVCTRCLKAGKVAKAA